MRHNREILSARVGRSYRLLFRLTGNEAVIEAIIHRRALDATLSRL